MCTGIVPCLCKPKNAYKAIAFDGKQVINRVMVLVGWICYKVDASLASHGSTQA